MKNEIVYTQESLTNVTSDIQSTRKSLEHIGLQLKANEQIHSHLRYLKTEIHSLNNKTITYLEKESNETKEDVAQVAIQQNYTNEQIVLLKEDFKTLKVTLNSTQMAIMEMTSYLSSIEQGIEILVKDNHSTWYSMVWLLVGVTLHFVIDGVYVVCVLIRRITPCFTKCFDWLAEKCKTSEDNSVNTQDSNIDRALYNELLRDLVQAIRDGIREGQRHVDGNVTSGVLAEHLSAALGRIGVPSTNSHDQHQRRRAPPPPPPGPTTGQGIQVQAQVCHVNTKPLVLSISH